MVMNVGDASRLRRVGGRGDPGFFSSIAKLGAGLGKLVPGLGTAITIGEGIGALGPKIFPVKKSAATVYPTSLPPGVPADSPLGRQILARGGSPLPQGMLSLPPGMKFPTALALKPPQTRGSSALAPMDAQLVGRRRYRRMNPTNFRALTRGIRRIKAFAKLARQVLKAEARIKAPRKGRFVRRKKR
jgi:hypothetical protein